jgi:hypothetical protein
MAINIAVDRFLAAIGLNNEFIDGRAWRSAIGSLKLEAA